MKACVIQPPYSMDTNLSDEYFEQKIHYLNQCNSSVDIIVLPEYSDIPCAAVTKEEHLMYHQKYAPILLKVCAETARRCNAVVFVNALLETESGFRNTTYAFNRKGEVVGHYYKRHLPLSERTVLQLDSGYTREFSEPYVLEIEGIRYGFLTCYDFYFYEAFAAIARKNVDIIIGCSLQRSDTHEAIEIMGRFCAYNCNAYLLRASVSLDGSSDICGASMIVTPKGDVLVNMKAKTGLGIAEINPKEKYYKPAGFGNPPVAHYEYMEAGRNPWQYRPGGSFIVENEDMMKYPRVCAYRGFSQIAPENSMPAFGAAVAMGAEEIGVDLRYTKDGEIVSIHECALERISDGHGLIYEKNFAELAELDFGSVFSEAYKGLKIVKFEDILKKFAGQVIMNIHIKTDSDIPYEPCLFQKIINLVDKYDCRKYVYFTISNNQLLELAGKMAPDIPRVLGCDGHQENIVFHALKYGCKKVQLLKPYLNQELIDCLHENGILCNVFGSDDAEEAKKFLDMGIDTILTNDYNRVSQIVKEYKMKSRKEK